MMTLCWWPNGLHAVLPLLAALLSVQPARAAQTQIDFEIDGVRSVVVNPLLPENRTLALTNTSAELIAQANFAGLRAYASSLAMPTYSTRAEVVASWLDFVTIDSPGLTGTRGFAGVEVSYSWDIDMTRPQAAFGNSAVASVEINAGDYWSETVDGFGVTDCREPVCTVGRSAAYFDSSGRFRTAAQGVGTHGLGFAFIFGQSFPLRVELMARSWSVGSAGDQAYSFVDGRDTVLWGGFSGVLAAGVAVPFTLTSESGTDYRFAVTPVPEPAAVLLLFAGLIGLWLHFARSGCLRARGDRNSA